MIFWSKHFRFNISKELDPSKAMIMLNQTKRDFPIGSMVKSDIITDNTRATSKKYRDFFYERFEFTVFGNALKWQDMEKEKDKIDFTHADNALAVLSEKGIPVRGHCILWDVERHEPKWLLPMNRSDVIAQVQKRMKYVINHYKGKLPHWDVNNEQLHGDFFEKKTGDPDYLTKAFQMAHLFDPSVKLFTNDFNVVAGSGLTQAYVNLINRLKSTGAPISRIGTQNHYMSVPDITMVQHRLDLLATTGLPIWVTELDITVTDQDDKAEGYENILRTFFAHPGVEGVMFWGFWDKDHWRPRAAIVEGDDFKLNKAGEVVTRLLKEEWATHDAMHPKAHSEATTIRGFHGNYNATVYYDGQVVSNSQFYLHKGKDLTITVNITPN
ncbi:hypothetical protein CAPTEDRAFT_180458 [Capitella teleta]|uniref:GH10 domain-containing protein n=1 Tax=Capitella teleta TaxID=283909 RepID=R7U9Q2_CAPTE|nr:hypothetical protein CAPTEDRAFT_180458 [Capitella teleta]|eukprot:ELT99830.1 hypothetical protein CAPTEDRAFT_180458 [Capitella teleta]